MLVLTSTIHILVIHSCTDTWADNCVLTAQSEMRLVVTCLVVEGRLGAGVAPGPIHWTTGAPSEGCMVLGTVSEQLRETE